MKLMCLIHSMTCKLVAQWQNTSKTKNTEQQSILNANTNLRIHDGVVGKTENTNILLPD